LRTQNLRTKPCVRTLVNSTPGADRQCTLKSQISSRSVYYVGLERQKIPQGGPSATIVPSAFRALFRTVNVPALELEALPQVRSLCNNRGFGALCLCAWSEPLNARSHLQHTLLSLQILLLLWRNSNNKVTYRTQATVVFVWDQSSHVAHSIASKLVSS